MIDCPVCSTTFETAAGLQFHTKWQMCRFKCNFCVKSFVSKAAVKDHIKKKHDVMRRKSGDSEEEEPNEAKMQESSDNHNKEVNPEQPKQTSERENDWKEDPYLPQGWKCITRIINGKSKEFLLDPNSGIFPSVDSAVRFMSKHPKYSSEDIERIKIRNQKAPTKFPQIEMPLPAFNETLSKAKIENAKQKLGFKSQDWIEDDPTVPPGWKIRRTKSEFIEGPGSHFLTTATRVERRQVFLSPDGKMFLGRMALLDHMIKDGGYSAEDINTVEMGIEKRIVKWVKNSTSVPPGWKTRMLKGKELFCAPTGEMFLGRGAVLENLMAAGATSHEIFTVEKRSRGWEKLWFPEKSLPVGWKVRPIGGLEQSEVNSFYMSPDGQMFVGIDAVREFISPSEKEETSNSLVKNNAPSDDILNASDGKTDESMEISFNEEKEVNIDDASLDNGRSRDELVDDGEGQRHMSPPNCSHQDSSSASLINSSQKKKLFLEDEYMADVVASKDIKIKSDIESTNKTNPSEDSAEYEFLERPLSEIQIDILKSAYKQWPHPIDEVVKQIALETELEEQHVKCWFWNRTWTKIKSARIQAKLSLKNHVDQKVEDIDQKVEDEISIIDITESKTRKELLNKTPDKKTRAVLVLKSAFKVNPNDPAQERLAWLKRETGLKIGAILRWFRNRRSKMEKQEAKRHGGQGNRVRDLAEIDGVSSPTTEIQWIASPTSEVEWIPAPTTVSVIPASIVV